MEQMARSHLGLIHIPDPQMTMANFEHLVGHIIYLVVPQWSSHIKDLLINPHLLIPPEFLLAMLPLPSRARARKAEAAQIQAQARVRCFSLPLLECGEAHGEDWSQNRGIAQSCSPLPSVQKTQTCSYDLYILLAECWWCKWQTVFLAKPARTMHCAFPIGLELSCSCKSYMFCRLQLQCSKSGGVSEFTRIIIVEP